MDACTLNVGFQAEQQMTALPIIANLPAPKAPSGHKSFRNLGGGRRYLHIDELALWIAPAITAIHANVKAGPERRAAGVFVSARPDGSGPVNVRPICSSGKRDRAYRRQNDTPKHHNPP